LSDRAAERSVRASGPVEGARGNREVPPAGARSPDVRFGSSTNALAPISSAERSLAAGPRQWVALALVVAAALAADQVTKRLVSSQVALGDEIDVLGPFTIHHVQNTGIAFGLLSSATLLVIVLTALAVGWMIAFFARSGARHPVLPVGLGLVLGGSVSNLADRVRLGHVTDFLDLRFWPAFNLADTFIVVGVLVLLATLVAADREPRRPRRVSAEAPPHRP
jgi:signal peptidase II